MSTRKLLLADDSITIQKVVNLTFADEGIEVITVGDGDAAVEAVAVNTPDIVLADVHMPGKNGYQICEIIRANEATKNLPVVLLVGSFEPFDENEATRVGASAYLTKPFRSIRELVSQVSDLLAAADRDPLADMPETEDIDTLYRDSFTETVEMPVEENVKPAFDDSGIDDEMIETSYADAAQMRESIDFGLPVEEEAEELSQDDSLEFAAPVELEAEDEPENDFDSSFETNDAEEEESTATAFRSPFDTPAYDDLPAVEVAESEQSIFEETEPSIDEPAAVETISDLEIPPESSRPQYDSLLSKEGWPKAGVVDFEDLDLLELPKFSGGKTVKFATPEAAVAAGSNQQVVSLSPELMEILVQKVVEKLAEKY